MKIQKMISSTVLICAASASLPASGQLIGDTVEIWGRAQLNGSETLRDTVMVVDPGFEYFVTISQDLNYTLDIGADSITLETFSPWFSPWFNSGHEPTALEIRGLDFVGDPSMVIGGVSVMISGVIEPEDNAPMGYAAFSADNVEFGDDWVRIITGPYVFESGSVVQIDLTFVPAPSALALFGLGSVCTVRRRR